MRRVESRRRRRLCIRFVKQYLKSFFRVSKALYVAPPSGLGGLRSRVCTKWSSQRKSAKPLEKTLSPLSPTSFSPTQPEPLVAKEERHQLKWKSAELRSAAGDGTSSKCPKALCPFSEVRESLTGELLLFPIFATDALSPR